MMIFARSDTPTVSQIESLLLVQESQLDKYRHDQLAVANASANPVHTSTHGSQHNALGAPGVRGNASRGRGRQGRGRGRARGNSSSGTHPTSQLCGCYGHSVVECWYRFDEKFVPPPNVAQANAATTYSSAQAKQDVDGDTPTIKLAEALSLDSTCIFSELSSTSSDAYKDWYGDTGASHHVTANSSYLQYSRP